MKTQITTILAVCGALLASASSASALVGGKEAGSICIFDYTVYCWIDPTTYSWQKDHPDFAENEATGTLEAETDVAMIDPSKVKSYLCITGNRGVQMQSKTSRCNGKVRAIYSDAGTVIGETEVAIEIQDIDPTQLAMWGNHGGSFSGNSWRNFWNKENWHVDAPELVIDEETQIALMRPEFVDYDPYTDTFNPKYSGGIITEDTQMAMSKYTKEYMYTTCIPHGQSGNYRGTRLSSHSSHCNGYKARTYRSLSSTETQDTDGEFQIVMMRPEFVDYDPYTNTFNPKYSGKLDESDFNISGEFETQLAHHNACGEFNCKTDEVEAPIYSDVVASAEFGNCLLDDAPINLETLVDCRADACLGRKGYYGAVETVQ